MADRENHIQKPIIIDTEDNAPVHGAIFSRNYTEENIKFIQMRGPQEGFSDDFWCTLLNCTPAQLRTLHTEKISPELYVKVSIADEELQIIQELENLIKFEFVGSWLMLPNPQFDGERPVDLLARSDFNKLKEMIFRLASGMPK